MCRHLIMPGGRRSTLAVFSCSCSAVRLAVLLSMRAFRSATLSRYSASFVACAAHDSLSAGHPRNHR